MSSDPPRSITGADGRSRAAKLKGPHALLTSAERALLHLVFRRAARRDADAPVRDGEARGRLRYLAGGMVVSLAVLAASLVVWQATRTSTTPAPKCTGAQSFDFGCLAARYEVLTRVSGSKAALADLAEQRTTNGYLIAACHQLTHVVGRTAGQIHGPVAFTQGSELCSSGYYHGVTEAVMMNIGEEYILDQAQAVCATHRERHGYSFLHYNCVHGMGHGFMAVFGTDVFRSLSGCDVLTDPWEQHHCYGGVFMENLTAMDNPSRPSKDLRPDEPLYPCTAVQERYKGDCYVKQTAYAVYVRNDDFGAVFKLCLEDADIDFRAVCYQGIGGDAAIKSSKYVIGETAQSATIRQLCLLGPDNEARSNCVAGAVTTIVRDRAGDDRKVRALCHALADQQLAAVCETTRKNASEGVPAPEGAHHH